MKLIGMLDSPYVRRAAITFQLLKLRFDHQPISVFRTYDQFRQINPVVKAPSLICDDGQVLMDSTLIIDYAESIAGNARSLMPTDRHERQRVLQQIGLALAACEKSVSIIYERNLRPAAKLHQPWVDRVTVQLLAAYQLLEKDLGARPLAATSASMNQAGVSVAVGWHFTQQTLPEVVVATDFPALVKFSARAERLPEFLAAPHGAGTYRSDAATVL
jgi:glutathione S-transferase